MSKIWNVIAMVELLQTGRKYSIKELADTLEVTERMIRLYKEELEKPIYIDTIMEPYGGYVLNKTVSMPVRKFKMSDSKLLDKYISIEQDEKIKNELIILQNKIKGVCIASKQENLELNLKEEKLLKYNLFKVLQAYEKVVKPCVALDAGFYIQAYPNNPNFPGGIS